MRYCLLLLAVFSSWVSAREISACGHPEYPPVSWLQGENLQGIAPAVAKHLFAQLGYSLKIDTSGNWERCLQEVRLGNIDLVLAAYQTQERTQYLDYTSQYLVADPLSIFVHRSQLSHYQSRSNLVGKRVGLLIGDSFGDQFDAFLAGSTTSEYVSRGRQNLAKLAHQRIDFMPLGISSGQLQVAKFGFQNQIGLSPITIGTEHYYLAIGKYSQSYQQLQQYLPALSKATALLHKSGQIAALQQCFNQSYLTGKGELECNVEP